MMRPDQYVLAERLLDHVEQRTTDMSDSIRIQDVDQYISPSWLARERATIFRRFPLLVGFSTDFANPGDYRAQIHDGVPVLLVRGQDGQLNAFLNVCSHRAAPLAEGCGLGVRGFVCPYHGWVYGINGDLVRIPGGGGFPELDRATLGLQRLPVQEKYGLVWLALSPDATFEIDDHLGDFALDLAGYKYEPYQHYYSKTLKRRMNWKLVIDTFIENYHLQTLHRATIGDKIMSFVQLADTTKNNLRTVQARKSYGELRDTPKEQWDFIKNTAIGYLLFPNSLFIHQSDHVELWRSYPDGDDPNSSIIHFDFYIPEPATTERAKQRWNKNVDYGIAIVLEEDFILGEKCQAAFHERESVIYGRNESGLIHYHSAIQRVVEQTEAAQEPFRPVVVGNEAGCRGKHGVGGA
jgi:phenylpropionate dioxygenase-like ring-hydroxylating dioxygenase large terminal subunit